MVFAPLGAHLHAPAPQSKLLRSAQLRSSRKQATHFLAHQKVVAALHRHCSHDSASRTPCSSSFSAKSLAKHALYGASAYTSSGCTKNVNFAGTNTNHMPSRSAAAATRGWMWHIATSSKRTVCMSGNSSMALRICANIHSIFSTLFQPDTPRQNST